MILIHRRNIKYQASQYYLLHSSQTKRFTPKPRLLFDCYQAVRIAGASWIEVQGLKIDGSKAGITLELAREYEKENRPEFDNDGIVVGPPGDFYHL